MGRKLRRITGQKVILANLGIGLTWDLRLSGISYRRFLLEMRRTRGSVINSIKMATTSAAIQHTITLNIGLIKIFIVCLIFVPLLIR